MLESILKSMLESSVDFYFFIFSPTLLIHFPSICDQFCPILLSILLMQKEREFRPKKIKRSDSTIPSLLRFCRNEEVIVELKNGQNIEGVLVNISSISNLTLLVQSNVPSNVPSNPLDTPSPIPPPHTPPPPSTIHIRGNLVRYIIFKTKDSIARQVNVGKERSAVNEKR